MNPQMFNSFLDGTKSAIEMAAVANATGLTPAPDGLALPAVRRRRPAARAAAARRRRHARSQAGRSRSISSLERDGRPVFRDLRWGVYVVFEAPSDYVARCFAEYGLVTDPSRPLRRAVPALPPDRAGARHLGRVRRRCAASRPARRPASAATSVATAKRDLAAGEMLDGEGGFTVWGKLMPADRLAARSAACRSGSRTASSCGAR